MHQETERGFVVCDRPDTGPARVALAVADAGWYTTEHLFRELDDPAAELLLLHCLDFLNGHRKDIYPWSSVCRLRRAGPRIWERRHVLPSGWMKRFPRLGMRPIARTIKRWRNGLAGRPDLALVMTYPYYSVLADLVRPDISVYYNIDDYSLYWPRDAQRLAALERSVVQSADLTICVARQRALELSSAVPEAADRIHHIPHGAPAHFLADRPLDRPAPAPADLQQLPRPILGYIGSLEDRVDWELLDQLAVRMPQASIVLIGRVAPPGPLPWRLACDRCLARPNVHALGWRSQELLPGYAQAFDVALVPYLVDHPFNRACCPTKIMDAMAASRPIVATAIPECRLHEERFHVAADTEQFLDAVACILARDSEDGRSALRLQYARDHACSRVASKILGLIQNSRARPKGRPIPNSAPLTRNPVA